MFNHVVSFRETENPSLARTRARARALINGVCRALLAAEMKERRKDLCNSPAINTCSKLCNNLFACAYHRESSLSPSLSLSFCRSLGARQRRAIWKNRRFARRVASAMRKHEREREREREREILPFPVIILSRLLDEELIVLRKKHVVSEIRSRSVCFRAYYSRLQNCATECAPNIARLRFAVRINNHRDCAIRRVGFTKDPIFVEYLITARAH